MRDILLIAAAVLIAACGGKRVSSPLPLLPESLEGEPRVEGMPIFTLAAGGRVLFRGKDISYGAIGSELKALSPAPKVVGLRIHAEEPWIHVQWAVAAIAERDITRARAIYSDGDGGEFELELTVWPSNLLCVLPVIPDKDGLLLQIAIASDGRFRCGERIARAASELDAWPCEIFAREIAQRRTELPQCIEDPVRVGGRGADPEIDVAGGARESVCRERVGSDNEILNPGRGRCGQHVAIVGIRHRRLRGRPTPARDRFALRTKRASPPPRAANRPA